MKRLNILISLVIFVTSCQQNFVFDDVPATWQITYTSTDGELVWCKYSEEEFGGASLVFNIYEDGKGAIIFNREVTTISAGAFEHFTNLASITIPDSVTSIGEYAFYDCSSLASITIPDSVTSIGEFAFCDCSSLTSVTIPDSVTSIGDRAFYGCSSLTSVTIPDSVTRIGDNAFARCSNLASVYCKSTTPPILGGSGFLGNAVERKIYVPATSVNAYRTANGWEEYADVICPEGYVPESENCKIYYTSADGKIVTSSSFSSELATFGAKIVSNMYKNGQGCITFDWEVTKIGEFAFYDCSSLASITIPDSVTSIGDGAFSGCSSLTSVTIPDSVTLIGDSVFYDCDSLTSVAIGNSVTSIGESAFYDCSSLASITIPDSVTWIEDSAFSGCDNLESVYCKSTTPPILGGEDVFSGNTLNRTIFVPASDDDSVINAYRSANVWRNYASHIVEYNFTE